jgi:mRNA-degrading endonuclease toxin of MazEF toxin-antitoxin module
MKPGEIYLADVESGKHPAVILSREELNRGNWVVAVLITSAQFEVRRSLPNCVALRAGGFGLVKNRVVQAEAITFLSIADLDLDTGLIGILDDLRMRDVIRAVGNMMGSECEPE